MKEFGCERLATGHYARVARERMPDGCERYLLLEAIDEKKDQSYYLHGLTQEQLQYAIFPLGAMKKSEVYALAEEFNVPFDEAYRESQDLCFFPEKTPQEFLRRHLRDAIRPGAIVRRDGTVVGTHEGLPLYTVGQRRGLKVGGLKVPLEVVYKDASKNQLVVDEQGTSEVAELKLSAMRWVSWMSEEQTETAFECRTRSLGPRYQGKLIRNGQSAIFRFKQGLPPQAPGQSLVLYRGEEVVGGGVIEG
jgi:tRNA-specific 2-thiouridylase